MRKLRMLAALLVVIPALHGCFMAAVGGAGTAAVMGSDRRTVGTQTEDQGIEIKGLNRINEKFFETHINVTSYNRMVLLTGEAPDAATRLEIERIARSVENVRGIYNEITIGPVSGLSLRANDSFLTSKVKARFIDQQKFNAVHVKVVSERGVAYLLGIVRHKEADEAVEITRTTSGVQKVVKLFEFID